MAQSGQRAGDRSLLALARPAWLTGCRRPWLTRHVDPRAWPVVGPTTITTPPIPAPDSPPARWADALITD